MWFSLGTPVSSTNKTDCHEITEILLKVALSTIALALTPHILSASTSSCELSKRMVNTINHIFSLHCEERRKFSDSVDQ